MSESERVEPRVTTERHGAVLHIGFNRPEKRNAADQRMLQELAAAYGELDRDPSLRAGVVWAAGDHFTAGLDLADVAPRMARGELDLIGDGGVDPWGLHTPPCSKPVVVAIQGTCFTLGIELALASDVAIASEDASFAQLEVARGIIPFGGATLRFPRLGWSNAMRWMLTGDTFDAAEALRMGLVQEVVAPGAARERAHDIAARIAAQAPLAVQATLQNARHALADERAAIETLTPTVQRLAGTSDARRAAEAFLSKQPVAFEGD